MAQILVRDIDDETARRLTEKARAEGKSAEETVRGLIADYVRREGEEFWAVADRIRKSTVGKGVIDPVQVIREDRDTDHGHEW